MRRSIFLSAAIAAISFAAPNVAQASLTSAGTDCNASILNPTFSFCGGSFTGNVDNQLTDINAYITSMGFTGANYLGTSDPSNGNAGFGPFTGNPSGLSSGSINFDAPVSGNFVLALKAANAFSLYFFSGASNVSAISFTTNGVSVNGNNVPQGLSHAALFGTSNTTININAVPEPSTYALMGAGLLALGFVARRRKA